jgi:hypothetical protein
MLHECVSFRFNEGSVVLWSEFLATDPEVPDFLRSSGSGTGPLSLMRITEELLERTVAAPV